MISQLNQLAEIQKKWSPAEWRQWEWRVRELEELGLGRSDAQGTADAELLKLIAGKIDGMEFFSRSDWDAYQGCEGWMPQIAHPHGCDFIYDEKLVSAYIYPAAADGEPLSWLREFGSDAEAHAAARKMLSMGQGMSESEWFEFLTLVLGSPLEC